MVWIWSIVCMVDTLKIAMKDKFMAMRVLMLSDDYSVHHYDNTFKD